MAYSITKTNGTQLTIVADGIKDTSATSLSLVGKNFSNYGIVLNQNFVQLLENFSNNIQPSNPLKGQLWWRSDNNTLHVYDANNSWKTIASSTVAAGQPTSPAIGDYWFNNTNNQLSIWNGTQWVAVGLTATPGTGKSGAIVEEVIDINSTPHIVIKNYVNNEIISIISKDSFTPAIPIPGFAAIPAGITINNDAPVAIDNSAATKRYVDTSISNAVGSAVANVAIINGSVTPSKLSPGHPWWTTSGNFGIGIDTPGAPLQIGTQNSFSVYVDQGNTAQTRYYQIGTINTNNGELQVSGALSGHDKSQGKVLVDVKFSLRDGLLAVGAVYGNFGNSDIVIYSSGTAANVYLKTGLYSLVNLSASAVSGASVAYNGTYSTTVPTGALVFTLSSDTGSIIRVNNSGDVGIGTTSPTQKLTVAGVVESTVGGFKFPDSSVQTKSAASYDLPIGAIMHFAGTSSPPGWILANGGAASRTEYAELYAVIGTTYGTGNGTTSFNIPDLRGVFASTWNPYIKAFASDRATYPVAPGGALYSVAPSVASVNEGGTVTFTFTTDQANATYYWTNAGTTSAADFSDGQNSGSFSVTSGTGSFTRTLSADATTEGSETIVIQVRSGSVSGPVVATSSAVTVNDTSILATYSISASALNINEGDTVTFTFTTNQANGTYYWTNGGSTVAGDFTDNTNSGSFTVTNGTGSFSRQLSNDAASEGTETIIIQVRTGSTAGTVVATSSTIVINDTSIPSYAVTANPPTTVNEGNTITFTFTTNQANGTYYWTTTGTTNSADFTDSLQSGSFTVTNGSGTISRTLVNDAVTEGTETIEMQIRSGSTGGTILASTSVSVGDTSQTPVPTYSVNASATAVNEGSTVNFTFTTNQANGTYYWTVSGSVNQYDFDDGIFYQNVPYATYSAYTVPGSGESGPYTSYTSDSGYYPTYSGYTSGAFTVTNGSGTISRKISADYATEGNQTFTLQVRTGSTGGTIVASSQLITIIDTSTTPPNESPPYYGDGAGGDGDG